MIGTLLLLAALGCRGQTCHDGGDCGFGELCDNGTCVGRTCTTSTQCPIGERCLDGACLEGCAVDDDCLASQRCDESGQCAARACVDAKLDCGYREWCVEGACVDAGPPYCEPCTEDDQCGEGNLCWVDEWCAVDCSDGKGCPAGFDCAVLDGRDGQPRELCVTACWMFVPR